MGRQLRAPPAPKRLAGVLSSLTRQHFHDSTWQPHPFDCFPPKKKKSTLFLKGQGQRGAPRAAQPEPFRDAPRALPPAPAPSPAIPNVSSARLKSHFSHASAANNACSEQLNAQQTDPKAGTFSYPRSKAAGQPFSSGCLCSGRHLLLVQRCPSGPSASCPCTPTQFSVLAGRSFGEEHEQSSQISLFPPLFSLMLSILAARALPALPAGSEAEQEHLSSVLGSGKGTGSCF